MSRLEKQLERLESIPKDFTWSELSGVLKALGFEEISGAGSRYKFRHPDQHAYTIYLHKPHGRNPPTVLSAYLRDVVTKLKEWGMMK